MDKSKLFKDIPEETYDKWFAKLEEMRKKHPDYRNDQLLMYLLCECTALMKAVGVMHRV